jgi:hypothetical protein
LTWGKWPAPEWWLGGPLAALRFEQASFTPIWFTCEPRNQDQQNILPSGHEASHILPNLSTIILEYTRLV